MTDTPADQNEGLPEPALPGGDIALLAEPADDGELPEGATVEAERPQGRLPAPGGRARSAVATAASLALHLAVLAFFLGASDDVWQLSGIAEDGTTRFGDATADRARPTAVDVAIVEQPKPEPVPKQLPPPSPPAKPVPETQETPKRQVLAAPPTAEESIPEAVPPEPGPPAPEQSRNADTPAPDPVPRAEAAIPVPTPRPSRRPEREAAQMAGRQGPVPGRSREDQRRGTLGGLRDGTAASSRSGRADEATGDAAATDYPGTIARKLNDALRYPAEAARRQVTGQARVQFVLDASGKVVSVEVIGSSGSDILDRAAIETVHRAAPFPPIPPETGRAEWPFNVTLAFGR